MREISPRPEFETEGSVGGCAWVVVGECAESERGCVRGMNIEYTVVRQRENRSWSAKERRRNGLEGEAARGGSRRENAWNGKKNSEGKREKEREKDEKGTGREPERTRQRETKRDGDLGSAYRSGRVTCVPEVGVLAWTNRRATPLSLSLSL